MLVLRNILESLGLINHIIGPGCILFEFVSEWRNFERNLLKVAEIESKEITKFSILNAKFEQKVVNFYARQIDLKFAEL